MSYHNVGQILINLLCKSCFKLQIYIQIPLAKKCQCIYIDGAGPLFVGYKLGEGNSLINL